jgi:hypothetical protein
MTLIWPLSPALPDITGPRLHAFLIGVSDYPHLTGGTKLLANDPMGLSQVSTPHYTALALADWLRSEYRHPSVPLGSVELVFSPSPGVPIPDGMAPSRATMHEIKVAFSNWLARCNTHRDNIALFYFVGHGIAKTDQFLLPEDFGDPNRPNAWENCVNFNAFHMGMRNCKAQTQIFFVDACRETPFGLLTQLNPQGDPLITATTNDSVLYSSVYRATTEGKQAFGPTDNITYFGQALLSCLRGVGAMNYAGNWLVNTASLGNALAHALEQLGLKVDKQLTCHPAPQGTVTIAQAPKPRVLAVIQCSSPAASKVSEITLQNGLVTIQSALGQPRPIVEEVDGGDWEIHVKFPNNEYPPQTLSDRLMPPVYFGVPVP